MEHCTQEHHEDGTVEGPTGRQVEGSGPLDLSRGKSEGLAFTFRTDGCIDQLKAVHQSYMDGYLSEEECWNIDRHLFCCRYCQNHFDALTSQMEESFPCEIHDAEDEETSDSTEDGFSEVSSAQC